MRTVKVEVRATHLKKLRQHHGLTQRQLARDLGISQNYIPALEAGARRAGPKLQSAIIKYFRCRFEDVFELVLVDPETAQERPLVPKGQA